MTMKIIPNVPVELPLTAYYGITFLGLNVGNTGLSSCVLQIGNEQIHFSADANDKTILKVNGRENGSLTYRLKADKEKMVLGIPHDIANRIGNEELLLHHYLSYSVPTASDAA